jgi:hypothetical protein
MPKLSIAQMAAELALKSKPKKIIQGAEREANLAKFLENSKVKEPMYHGTKSDINEFNPKAKAVTQGGQKVKKTGAMFFTDNPHLANQYTGTAKSPMYDASPETGGHYAYPRNSNEGGNVMPVHLNMENPYVIDANGQMYHQIEDQIAKAKKLGYDSVILNNVYDSPGASGSLESIGHNAHIVFDPKQIKSAIGNEGTFNPKEVDITKADGGIVHMVLGGKALEQAIKQGVKKASKAENIAMGLYHPIGGGKKLKRPISEMGIKSVDNPNMPLVPKKTIKYEEMVGGAGVPLTVDRSGAGKLIQEVGNQPLIRDVPTQGGIDYTRWNEAFASLPNVANRYGKKIQEASKMQGVDPNKIFGLSNLMSHTGIDFSHQPMEVLLNQFDPTLLDKKRVKEFNSAVRNHPVVNQKTKKVTYPFMHFSGIETPEGRHELLETSNWGGELRKNVMHKIDLDDFADMGLPSVAEARVATTEPRIMDAPTGTVGHNIARFNPEGIVTYETDKPHYSYTGVIQSNPTLGGYAGEAEQTLPMHDIFQDYFDVRRALDKPESTDMRALSMSMPIQKFDQEWLDRVKKAQEAQDLLIKTGSYKDGGQVQNFDKGGSVTIEGLRYEPEETYTDPMGMSVPSQDEMRLAISKQNMSPMPYSEPYSDPVTGAILKNGLEALPPGSNIPKTGGMTPIDWENLPEEEKERTIGDRVAGLLETGATIGSGVLASPYAFGKGLMSGDFNNAYQEAIMDNMYTPRDKGAIENLELLGKGLEPFKLPPMMPELLGLEPIISSATRRGIQLGAKGVKTAGKTIGEHAYNKTEDFLKSQGLMPAITPEMKPSVTIEPQSPKDAFGFYSKLEKEAQNIQRKQGNGQAFMNDLIKLGAKPSELEDTGMAEFLKNNKTLTKDDVVGFAQRNRPNMKEQTLSKEMNLTFENEPNYYNNLVNAFGRDERLPRIYDSVNVKNNGVLIGNIFEEDSPYSNYYAYSPFADDYESFDTKEQAIKYLKENAKHEEESGNPKHEGHFRTEGGENYREVLVQIPEKNITQGQLLDDMARRLGAKNFESLPMEQRHELASLAKGTPFTKGHYPDFPNTMINMRMDDRVDVEGKKGTLLDELQSDWHQKGKEHGYNQFNEKDWNNYLDDLNKRFSDYANTEWKKFGKKFIDEQIKFTPANSKAKILNEEKLYRDNYKKVINKIPDAPYKNNWHELGLKKAIQQSVERGDDRLYMPTGKTLADRYKLSNHINELNYYEYGSEKDNKHFNITIKDKNGVANDFGKAISAKDLPDYVGKEMAKKILNNEGDTHPDYPFAKRFSGLDLEVGGEGMRKYYDEIYPSFLKKFAKKYGGHVGETEIDTKVKYYLADKEGNLLDDAGWSDKNDAMEAGEWRHGVGDKKIDWQVVKKGDKQKVYYYEPSPEAKKKIMGGLPYKKGGIVKMNEGGSIESDPSLPLRAHIRKFQSPDLMNIEDYGVSASDDGDSLTLGRQFASKNANDENPNMRFRTSQDYAQYSTPMHRGMLNAKVMKNPEQPSVQAMLQYMQQMGGGTAGIGLMGNRTSEGDKLRALQMMYNHPLSDTSDISAMLALPFGDKPQGMVQYRKRFNEGGSVADREIAKMKEMTEKAMIRRELSGGERVLNEFNSSKPTSEIKPIQPVNEQLVNQEYNARRTKPTVALEPIGRGGSRIPSTQLELFKKKGGNVSIDEMQLALMRKK